jgi:polysaccharide biosynthesis/export protein
MMIMCKTCKFSALVLFGVSLAFSLQIVAQTPAQNPVDPNAASEIERARQSVEDDAYRIGAGDLLDITVSKQPDYSREGVRVDNNGMIQIPRDDQDLRAACKTTRQLSEDIKARYKRYLRNPYVLVQVKEYLSQPVAVIGAVNAPGRFQLQRRVRLLELLTMVNGPSPTANGTVQLIRSAESAVCDANAVGNESTVSDSLIAYDLNNTLAAREDSNPYLRPGDIVRLPEAAQAFVVGAVKTPNPIVLKEPVTLSEAIARAGGLLPEANSEKITISRHVPGAENKTELVANLKAIKRQQQKDILLQPNDIVEVAGPSGSKKLWGTILKNIAPSMARYPLGVVY